MQGKTKGSAAKTEYSNEAAIKAIICILQNHAETAIRSAHMKDRLMGRTELYTNFKEKLKEKSGTDVDLILSGSISQRLVAFHWVYPSLESGQFGRKAGPDIDVLVVDKSYTALEKFQAGPYLVMQPTNNPGYVRLFKGHSSRSSCISSKGFRKYWRSIIDEIELFTRFSGRGQRFPNRGNSISGPAVTKIENVGSRDFFDHDFVPAVRCASWPRQAQDWLNRKRVTAWPSQDLIKTCFQSECHVVPVGQKESARGKKGKEWRLSFTKPELLLAQSFDDRQRQAYITAKMLIKAAINQIRNARPSLKHVRLIASYDIKTTMFWLCEAKADWNNVLQNIKDIFKALLDYYEKCFLPDYFIPEKNILTGITDGSVDATRKLLTDLMCLPVSIMKQCFNDAYGSLFHFDENESPLLRKLFEEICIFEASNLPTVNLFLLSILRLLLELTLGILRAHKTPGINLAPCVRDLIEIHSEYLESQDGATALFKDEDLKQVFWEDVRFEQLTGINNIFLNILANRRVIAQIGNGAFAVLSVLFNKHVMFACIEYIGKQEVVDLASAAEEDRDNPVVRNIAEQSYGSVEKLLERAADLEEEAEEMDFLFSQTAETALTAYYNLMDTMEILDSKQFECHDEKIIVGICSVIERHAPGILEEESFGSERALKRLELLREKYNEKELRHRVG